MRILIVKPSSLGDIIHALPAVNLIHSRYPDAHITWLINAEFSSLLNRCPVINARIEFRRRDPSAWLPLLRQLRRERFDLVIDLQGLLRTGIFSLATGAPRRIGLSDAREGARFFYTEVVPVQPEHAVTRYLRVTGETGPVEFPLGLDAVESKGWIAVNASARWKTKLWGDDNFATLIRQLPRDRVVLTGSASEAARLDQIAQGCRNVAGKTDLLELATLFRQCSVVITNDSGPMHLAAAVGTPVIAIFGPTDPQLTGPYGTHHIVLRAGIPCSPCFKNSCTNRVAMECMQKVTVEQVLAVAKPFLV